MEEDAVKDRVSPGPESVTLVEGDQKTTMTDTIPIASKQTRTKLRRTSDEPQDTKTKKKVVSEEHPVFSKIQLKKAETVRRVWDEPKPEMVELKHHEYESVPQKEVDELCTNILMTKPIEEVKTSFTKTQRVKKIKAKKFSEDQSRGEKEDEKELEHKPIQESAIQKKSSVPRKDSPREEEEIDTTPKPGEYKPLEKTTHLLESPGQKPAGTQDQALHQEKMEEDAMTDEIAIEPESVPIEEKDLKDTKVIENSRKASKQINIKLRKTSDEPQETKIQKSEVSEQHPVFSKIQLKKAETVKRIWDEPKPEVVELKHHEYEIVPQKEVQDLCTNISMSKAIEEIKAPDTKAKKVKKIKAKKFSEDQSKEEKKEAKELDHKPTEAAGPKKSSGPRKDSPKKEEPIDKTPESNEPETPEEAFKPRKKSSVAKKETPKKEEPVAPFAIKLKKSSQVKRTWDDDKMETVDLKHHESEKLPQEETPEKGTKVNMSEPTPDKNAIDKDKKKKKKKTDYLPQEETPEKSTEATLSEPIPDKEVLQKVRKKKEKVKSIIQAEPQGPPLPDTDKGSNVPEGSIEQAPDEPMDAMDVDSVEQKFASKKKSSNVIERNTEELPLGQVKLRKASVVKREWESPELQQVSLKHHILEQKPMDEIVRFYDRFYLISINVYRASISGGEQD